jgi:Tfp pilus assembly protein FimV
MVMRETGPVSFWTPSNSAEQVTYFFPVERSAYLRKRATRKRQRAQRIVATAVVALAAVLGFVAGRAGASGAKKVAAPRYVTVGEGQTLWSVARQHGDRSLPITERLDALVAANPQAASGLLTPGQRLKLP